ncbi:MAG: hypothetical protein P8Z80_10855 [Pseudolabrys sp.]
MLIQPRGKDRPFHLGPFPLEMLLRDESIVGREAARPKLAAPVDAAPEGPRARAAAHYRDLFAKFADGAPAPKEAPVPDDLTRRAAEIAVCVAGHCHSGFAGCVRAPE